MNEGFYMFGERKTTTTLYSFYSEFIYFFSRKASIELFDEYKKTTSNYYNGLYDNLIFLEQDEHLKIINTTDSELIIPFIVVYLWKQKIRYFTSNLEIDISTELSIDINESFGDNELRKIHRLMILTEYKGSYIKSEISNYNLLISNLIGFQKKPGFEDDDYFSWLLELLSVTGLKNVKKIGIYNEVNEFLEYILKNQEYDDKTKFIYEETFVMFLYCFNYNSDEYLNYFENLITNKKVISILTAILAIKVFDNKVLSIIENKTDYSFFGGIKNLYRLANLHD